MKKIITAYNIENMKWTCDVYIDLPSQCPLCDTGIEPKFLDAYFIDSNTLSKLFVLFFCPKCELCFMAIYTMHKQVFGNTTSDLLKIIPHSNKTTGFSDDICKLSPNFVEIYNQAELAESYGLNEICGLGYRKALEFLIKDFAIHKSSENSDSIKKLPLSQCINNYIDNDSIKVLAQRSTWIGNDEAHYLRKQKDHDVSDMKTFIQALVYFISMILVTETASSITPK